MPNKWGEHRRDKEGMKTKDGQKSIQKEKYCFLVINNQFLEPEGSQFKRKDIFSFALTPNTQRLPSVDTHIPTIRRSCFVVTALHGINYHD